MTSTKKRRCWGRTKNLTRCQNDPTKADPPRKFFCGHHKYQPYGWIFIFIFTVVPGCFAYYTFIFQPSRNDVAPPAGVSVAEFRKTAEELGVTKAALKSFFKTIEEKQVPPEDLDSTLRKIATRYKELQKKMVPALFDDSKVAELKAQAKVALNAGDFEKAEKLLNRASSEAAQCATRRLKAAHDCFLSAAELNARNGDLAETRLNYKKAAEYYQEAVKQIKKAAQFGAINIEKILADYLQKWGTVSYGAGDYRDGEQPLIEALQIREKALGPDHPSVAATLNNLANLYYAQSKYEAAEPLYQRSLKIREKALEPDDPDVAISINNLASLFFAQGKYETAELLYQRALKIWEKILGPNHPHIATTLNNLAELDRAQGKYEAAESLYLQALKIMKKAFPGGHPNIDIFERNLALMKEEKKDRGQGSGVGGQEHQE